MGPAQDADLAAMLEPLLEAAIKLEHADFGDIALYDSDQRTLRIVTSRGVGQEFLDHFGCTDASDAAACHSPAIGEDHVTIEDVNEYAPYAQHLAVVASTGYRGLSGTRLTERGTGLPLGMLTILFRNTYRPDETSQELSDLFAAQAADLISSHRAQRQAKNSSALPSKQAGWARGSGTRRRT